MDFKTLKFYRSESETVTGDFGISEERYHEVLVPVLQKAMRLALVEHSMDGLEYIRDHTENITEFTYCVYMYAKTLADINSQFGDKFSMLAMLAKKMGG